MARIWQGVRGLDVKPKAEGPKKRAQSSGWSEPDWEEVARGISCKLLATDADKPGDYNRAEAGTADQRVWSETGCTCLLITSTKDLLR